MGAARRPSADTASRTDHTKERAAFWCVSVRTMQLWKAARPPWPVDDVDGMIRWVAALPSASQGKLTREFQRRLSELRIERERETGRAVATDPDYQAFEANYDATHAKDTDALARLKRLRDFALFKLERAQARNDLAAVNDASKLLTHNSAIIHDEELRAQRLNREIGDTIPRADVERLGQALAYWLVRSADDLYPVVCKRISEASSSGPLFPEEVRAILEPEMISARVLQPFVRAAGISAPVALPKWLVDAMRASMVATIEDGAAHFDRLFHAPPAPAKPPAPA